MKIAIRKEPNGSIYIDKYLRDTIDYTQPPYNFKIIEIPDVYLNCAGDDFNDDLTFNIAKYTTRLAREQARFDLPIKIKRLEELTKDLAQVQVGLIIDDIEDRKLEFRTLLNEVRILQGKEPRNAIDTEQLEESVQ